MHRVGRPPARSAGARAGHGGARGAGGARLRAVQGPRRQRAGWAGRQLLSCARSLPGSGGVARAPEGPRSGPALGATAGRARAPGRRCALPGRGGAERRARGGGSEPQGLGVLARLEPQVGDAGVFAVALGGGGHDGGGGRGLGQGRDGQPEGRRREHQVGRVRRQVRVQVRVRVRDAFQLQLRLDLGGQTAPLGRVRNGRALRATPRGAPLWGGAGTRPHPGAHHALLPASQGVAAVLSAGNELETLSRAQQPPSPVGPRSRPRQHLGVCAWLPSSREPRAPLNWRRVPDCGVLVSSYTASPQGPSEPPSPALQQPNFLKASRLTPVCAAGPLMRRGRRPPSLRKDWLRGRTWAQARRG